MLCDFLANGSGDVAAYSGGDVSASSTPSSGSVLSNHSSEQTDRTSYASTDGTNHGAGMVEQRTGQQAIDPCNLIVNYLPYNVGETILTKMFSEYGELVSTKIIRDKVNKNSLGYGFVRFVDPACASSAIAHLNGYKLNGKVLKVSVARPPSEDIKNCKLYITNLPKTMSAAEVLGLFKKYGEIIECRLLQDTSAGSTVSRGVAFVQYNLRQEAQEALEAMNGRKIANSDKVLLVKYADDQQAKGSLRVHEYAKSQESYYPGEPGVASNGQQTWFPSQTGTTGAYVFGLGGGRGYMEFYPAAAAQTKVLVSSLPSFFNNSMLNDLFAQFGTVTAAKVKYMYTYLHPYISIYATSLTLTDVPQVGMSCGLCSGDGYVKMASGAEAQFAAQSLDGVVLSYDCPPLVVRVVWKAA